MCNYNNFFSSWREVSSIFQISRKHRKEIWESADNILEELPYRKLRESLQNNCSSSVTYLHDSATCQVKLSSI